MEADLKSSEVNAHYQRKVGRNKTVDAARPLMGIASSFQFPEEEEIDRERGIASQTDMELPLSEATQADLHTLKIEHVHIFPVLFASGEDYGQNQLLIMTLRLNRPLQLSNF